MGAVHEQRKALKSAPSAIFRMFPPQHTPQSRLEAVSPSRVPRERMAAAQLAHVHR
jgi:hypothetical protein